ncbi:hypothetical protein PtA15_11A223 [Puccinia triticina]|uniref:Exocyst complex component Sec10-like alpha-helical bundle domain-containing protein n=1 Tax=Puccinia triticina TaxID=208348 RepID=A0ABY7CW46_9BASI|nr:uncharacterized protein PtA15_11A223 [Puccinia triticina]WAQ89534.1 hypothetical protein PtA15_11A223 [Puccinia triticina]
MFFQQCKMNICKEIAGRQIWDTPASSVLFGPASGFVGYARTTFKLIKNFPVVELNTSGTRTNFNRFNRRHETVRNLITSGPAISALSGMLDQQLDELFGQHLDNSQYEERECKSLTELYVSYLHELYD